MHMRAELSRERRDVVLDTRQCRQRQQGERMWITVVCDGSVYLMDCLPFLLFFCFPVSLSEASNTFICLVLLSHMLNASMSEMKSVAVDQ